ncbi:MAG TPA: RodZ domain-containing protein [Nevskia sp.]|nr:RodZ domain-containing protein [Nevskia sp.]
MTTDNTAEPAASTETSESVRQGPGRLIRLARERARLGLPELAGLTKLAPATLEALERDDFAVLNEPVYVRGYYRKCAKALSLSEQELLSAYEKLVAPRAPAAPTKLLLGSSNTGSSLKKNRRRGGGTPWWLWLVAFGVLVGIAAFVLRENPGEGRGAAEPAKPAGLPAPGAAAAPAPAPEAGAARPLSTNELSTTPAERGQSSAPAAAEPAPAPQAAAPAAVPAPAQPAAAQPPAAAPAPAAPAAAAVSADALSLDFKATSWVRIEDAAGKVLLAGVIQQGDHQVLSGKPPYSLFLGNAPGVAVSYRGKTLDLGPYTRAKDNTARLSVPSSD